MIHSRPISRAIRGRLAAGVLVVAAVFVGASPASAQRPATEAADIASVALTAVEAYDRWEATGSPTDLATYFDSRDVAAVLTADDLGIDAEGLVTEWREADIEKQRTILAAMSQLGVPYRSMASEPGVGFDCSGLTIWAYGTADVEIPRVSGDQITASTIVDRDVAEPGDLVHYPGHVGIYLGGNSYVHSPNSGDRVEAVILPDRSLSFGDLVEQS